MLNLVEQHVVVTAGRELKAMRAVPENGQLCCPKKFQLYADLDLLSAH